MYLLNDKNNVVSYDIDFNNNNEVIDLATELATKSIVIGESIQTAYNYKKMMERGNKQSISNPVYIGENIQDDTVKVVEYKSKTPYTLGLVGYYAKNNVLQTLYSSYAFSNGKRVYLESIVNRLMSNYIPFPQVYMTKCHFDDESYQNHNMLFENLSDNSDSLDFLIEEYYPDLKAFLELFPYIDFSLKKEYKNSFKEDSWQYMAAKYNTETFKQLGLTPYIRK